LSMLTVNRGEHVKATVTVKNTGTLTVNFVVGFSLRCKDTGVVIDNPWFLIRDLPPGEGITIETPWSEDTTGLEGENYEYICKAWKNYGGSPQRPPYFPDDWYMGGSLIGQLDENVGFDREFRIVG
jgi:hypothetical protein